MSDTGSQCQRITVEAARDTITLAELKEFMGWAADKGFPDDSSITTSAIRFGAPADVRTIRVERPARQVAAREAAAWTRATKTHRPEVSR